MRRFGALTMVGVLVVILAGASLVAAGCAKPTLLKAAGVRTVSKIVASDPSGKLSLTLDEAARNSMVALLEKAKPSRKAPYDITHDFDLKLTLFGPAPAGAGAAAPAKTAAEVFVRHGEQDSYLGLLKGGARTYFYTAPKTELERLVPFLLPAGFAAGMPAELASGFSTWMDAADPRVFRVDEETGTGSYLVVAGGVRPGYEVMLKRVDVRPDNSYTLIYARQALPAGHSVGRPAAQAGTQLTVPKSATIAVGVEGAMVPVEALRTAKVNVYFANAALDKLVTESRQVMATAAAGNIQAAALSQLIRGPQGKDLQRLLPGNTEVLGVSIKDGIAYANFSRALVANFVGGSGVEALAIASIADTLTDFPGIQRVQILIEGKKVETLGGHIDISQPLPRNEVPIGR